jgi:hypothetical protein
LSVTGAITYKTEVVTPNTPITTNAAVTISAGFTVVTVNMASGNPISLPACTAAGSPHVILSVTSGSNVFFVATTGTSPQLFVQTGATTAAPAMAVISSTVGYRFVDAWCVGTVYFGYAS